MNRSLNNVLTCFILLLWGLPVFAQTTGSHVGSENQDTDILWLNPPDEIDSIRELLQGGEANRAVTMAREYVDSLEYLKSGGEGDVLRYFALNALCVALTNTGELSEAITICDRAIDLFPSRWQAINNRGTAYLVSGEYAKALQDYKQAMSVQTGQGAAVDIIQGNINLTEIRLSANP